MQTQGFMIKFWEHKEKLSEYKFRDVCYTTAGTLNSFCFKLKKVQERISELNRGKKT